MSITVRRATGTDAGLLVEQRMRMWDEFGEWGREELLEEIAPLTSWTRTHLDDGTYVAFVAEEDGEPIGGGVLVHLAMPRPGFASARRGRVQSVYVVPGARRRGVARAIMERLIAFARDADLIALALRPSDEARPLYASLGFAPADELILRLHEH